MSVDLKERRGDKCSTCLENLAVKSAIVQADKHIKN